MAAPTAKAALVLDTNVVLDLLVFNDPAIRHLKLALECSSLDWLATDAMRAELEHVLVYPHIAARVLSLGLTGGGVLSHYDRLSQTRSAAPPAAVRCSDPDDQIFIDLAVAHQAQLLSKDLALLRLRKRLAGLGVRVKAAYLSAIGDKPISDCSRKLCALASGQDCR